MIRAAEFLGNRISTTLKKAMDWINENDIDVISVFEKRYFWYHGGIVVVYRESGTIAPTGDYIGETDTKKKRKA